MNLFVSFGIFLLSILSCTLVARTIKSDPHIIRDPLHLYLPHLKYKYLSDIMVSLQIILLVFTIKYWMLKEFFLICGITQFMRAITMSSTILPSLEHHNDKIRFGGINGRGTEYIFSGHAVYACLSFIYLYLLKFNLPILVLYNIISQMTIILSRNHYTV